MCSYCNFEEPPQTLLKVVDIRSIGKRFIDNSAKIGRHLRPLFSNNQDALVALGMSKVPSLKDHVIARHRGASVGA